MTGPDPLDPGALPVDSDLDVDETATGYARPIHLRWRYLGLVAVGGAMGTAIREGLSLTFPATAGPAWIIVVINVVGAFTLGVLLESLGRRGPDEGRRRTLRLLVGTGLLGGFTTYSSLATATALLLKSGQPGLAIIYALATVLLGAAGSIAGIAMASARHRRRINRQSAPGETIR